MECFNLVTGGFHGTSDSFFHYSKNKGTFAGKFKRINVMNTDIITRNERRKVILDVDAVEYPVFIKLIKNLDFVHIIQDGDSEEDIIANLTQGFKELKLYKQGKLKTTPAKDFLNAL